MKTMNTHIVETYNNIERIEQIDKEREEVMQDKEFIQWCNKLNIGTRVKVKDYRANELMQQYSNYPKWVQRNF